MYSEDDLLPLSGLQHLAYCPRQFAMVHLEQAWAEIGTPPRGTYSTEINARCKIFAFPV